MSLLTAAALAAHRKFPRVTPAATLSALHAGEVPAFERLQIDYGSLSGGKTADRIQAQGSRGQAIVRRSGVKATKVGWIDYHARHRAGADSFTVLNTDGSATQVTITVADALPASYRVLAPAGGDYTDWKAAVESGFNIVVRAGTYHVSQAYASRPILGASGRTIMAHPDDVAAGNLPVVQIEGSTLKQFHEAPAGKWQDDPDSSTPNVYRSVATNIPIWGANATALIFVAGAPGGGRWLRLIRYPNLTQLRDTSYAGGLKDRYYMGPGFAHSGGRLYIRLDAPPLRALRRETQGTYPWSEFTAYFPTDKNPNNHKIYVGYSTGTLSSSRILEIAAGANNALVKNFRFVGGGYQTRNLGTGIKYLGCEFLAGAKPENDGENYHGSAIRIENSGSVFADRCLFSAGWCYHRAYRDGKTGSDGGPAGWSMRTEWITLGTNCSLEVANSIAEGYFLHGWLGANVVGAIANEVVVRHSVIRDTGRGGLLTHREQRNVYWIRTHFADATIFDYSSANVTTSSFNNTDKRPNLYVGNCLFTAEFPKMLGSGYITSDSRPWYMPRWHTAHAWPDNMFLGHPVKYYNNTSVARHRREHGRAINNHDARPSWWTQPVGLASFNNLFCLYKAWEDWGPNYAVAELVAAPPTNMEGYPENAVYDNNHYFKHADVPGTAFIGINTATNPATVTRYSTLSAFTAGSGKGWEANGTGGTGSAHDPRFVTAVGARFSRNPGDYHLAAGSPCRTGAKNISQSDWNAEVSGCPDYDGPDLVKLVHRPHRGCIDPAVPAPEQEIGPL